MLVISRKTGEEIQIGNSVKITVINIDRGVVRIGIEAPKDIPIKRIEIIKDDAEVNEIPEESNDIKNN
ncbi:MAG: carbon storage regulator [bacterium]